MGRADLLTRVLAGVVLETLESPHPQAETLKTHADIHVLEVKERDVLGDCDHLLRDGSAATVGKTVAVRGVLVLRVQVHRNKPERKITRGKMGSKLMKDSKERLFNIMT